jgi:hypothetical protein
MRVAEVYKFCKLDEMGDILVRVAMSQLNLSAGVSSHAHLCLRHRRKQAGGYKFRRRFIGGKMYHFQAFFSTGWLAHAPIPSGKDAYVLHAKHGVKRGWLCLKAG